MSHKHATIGDTVYFWFAANDTSGSGGDGATPLFDVREAGEAAGEIPLLSGTPTLLTHANYPAGCYEIAVAATVGNGFAANDVFAVFSTLAIDSQNPVGFVGDCILTPLATEAKQDTAQTDLDTLTGADGVTLATSQSNYAPNTTVPDAAGVAPTAVEIRQEMDANSTRLDVDMSSRAPAAEYDIEMNRITANVATEAKQDIIDTNIDTLLTRIVGTLLAGSHNAQGGDSFARIGVAGAGLTAIAQAATALTNVTWTDAKAVFIDAAISSCNTQTPLDAAGIRTAIGLAAANLDTQLADLPTVAEFTARTLLAASYGTASNQTTIAGLITSLNDLSAAQVNAEVSDVMKTDTIAEMAQGAPPTTPTLEEAVMYLYMALTKKIGVNATTKSFQDNAGTVIWKKTLSDDGIDYAETKGASGP